MNKSAAQLDASAQQSLELKELVETVKALKTKQQEMRHQLETYAEELRTQTENLAETEQELEASQKNYRHLFDFAPIGYFTVDRNTAIQEVNLAAVDMLSHSREFLMGKPLFLYVAPSDRPSLLSYFRGVFNGVATSIEVMFQGRDGRPFPVYLQSVPVREENGKGPYCLTAAIDISHQKRVEEDLRENERRLEEMVVQLEASREQAIQRERLQALGKMASGIAHGFNNALAPILGFSEVLLLSPEQLDDKERARQYIQMIRTAAQDASTIVNRLARFYRTRKTGDLLLPLDLNELIDEVVQMMEPRWKNDAQAAGINISVERKFTASLPLIKGMESELREMLTNLIFNALEAMPEDGTITFRTHTDGKDVVLQVSDTGVGMSEETRKHCLDPFFTTKHGTGTGLGLSIVFGTVQRHGGSLDIHSKLGKGTTFIIRFPAQADAQPSLKTDMVSSKPDRPLHVLVVEDEPLVQMMITEFLANGGHSAETANNGREGLEKFRSGTYDVVITDRAMPDMNGDRLALAIKQENPDFPVIMLTGYGNIMAASGEMPLGVDALMSKPISVIEFWEILTKVTARRR